MDYFFRRYDSGCYLPQRGRIHDATSNASLISLTPEVCSHDDADKQKDSDIHPRVRSKGRSIGHCRPVPIR